MEDPRPYVVRQGDYLKQLAHRGGYDADEVWHDPLNEDLRARRGSGDDLLPGDLLYVPSAPSHQLEVVAATENAYTAIVPRIELAVFFEDTDGALCNEPCRVFGIPGAGDDGLPKKSDDLGKLVLQVPVTVNELSVTFPNRHRSFSLYIGHMDPSSEQSGVVKRLTNLGYLDPDATYGEGDVAGALAAFQRNTGLSVTGQLDDATSMRLAQEAEVPPPKPKA